MPMQVSGLAICAALHVHVLHWHLTLQQGCVNRTLKHIWRAVFVGMVVKFSSSSKWLGSGAETPD